MRKKSSINSQWNKQDHEYNVEKFYNLQNNSEPVYLNFGYYIDGKNNNGKNDNMTDLIYDNVNIDNNSIVLDVGCGFGLSCISNSHKYNCKIIGVDCVNQHITESMKITNNQISELLSGKSKLNSGLVYGSATKLLNYFPINSFSHIISIEGGNHYNTRYKFLEDSYILLKQNGKLSMTEILKTSTAPSILGYIMAKAWRCPIDNIITTEELVNQLIEIGFKNITIKDISNNVFEEYYLNNFTDKVNHKKRYGIVHYFKIIVDYSLFKFYRFGYCKYVVIIATK